MRLQFLELSVPARFNRFDHIKLPAPTKSKISDDGLRYEAKPPGIGFAGSSTTQSGTLMSCIFCGTHRGPASRLQQRVLGRSHVVCNPPCAKNKAGLKAMERAMQEQQAIQQPAVA